MAKKNKKRVKYPRLGQEVGVEEGIVQAATVLDEVSHRVVRSGTNEEMFIVVDKWLELTAIMHAVLNPAVAMQQEKEMLELSSSTQIGFRATDEYLEELEIENGKKRTR